MCGPVFHQSLQEYCPLKRQLSLACRRNTYILRHSTNNSPTVSNLSSEVDKRHRLCGSSRTGRKTSSVASANIASILLFNFCEQKFVQHGPITIAIDRNGLSLLIFEEKLPNYDSGPKSAPYSDSFWVRRQFCLFTYPPRSKWASSEKMISLPKSVYSVSRSQAHFPALLKRIHKHIRSAEE